MGVMLEMHPGEDRKTEPQQKSRTMPHGLVDPAIGMGGVVAGIVDHRAFQMQGQETGAEQDWQRPPSDEPSPDGQCGQPVATDEQPHSGIPCRGGIDKFPGHGPEPGLLNRSRGLTHLGNRQRLCNRPKPS